MSPGNDSSVVFALITAVVFVLLLVFVTVIARVKKVTLPYGPPGLRVILFWVAIFAVAAAIQEMVGGYLGGEASPNWDALTPARALRAATIVLLAPLAEETALRGTLFGDLVKKGAHPALTVLIPAAVFALIHFQYAGWGLLFIFVDGVIFGLARLRTGSLFVPVLLHALGNAYAIGERILW